MNIQAEKLDLIRWLAEVKVSKIIKQLRFLQRSNQEKLSNSPPIREKSDIDKGLKSIKEGRVHSHEKIVKLTMGKYPECHC
jgi:hypothetical protein